MAEISIAQLATLVKTTPERLVEQLREAGVDVSDVKQTVNDDEKKKLLTHLRKAHSDSEKVAETPVVQKKKTVKYKTRSNFADPAGFFSTSQIVK